MHRLLLVTVFLSLVSCSQPSSQTSSNIINSGIMNGVDVHHNESVGKSVVGLYNAKEMGICTGTLIDNNLIVTAAHCAPKKAGHLKVIFAEDMDYVIYSREQDIRQQFMLQVTDFKISTKYNPETEEEFDIGDIAIIKFKGNLPEGYVPAKLLTDINELKIGTVATLVGYGVDTVKTTKINPKSYPNLNMAIETGEVVCDDNNNCVAVETEGEGKLRTTVAPVSELKETEVVLDEKKAGTCSGDSGGPAFIKKDGELYLFGVTSRGGALCNDIGVYTSTLYYRDWINESVQSLKN